MTPNRKIRKFAAHWPIGVVALGIVLTVIWIAAILWFPFLRWL
jgi:hypothetical protein